VDRPPTKAEINVHDSLDEQWAVKHMLGATREQAQAEFERSIHHWGESLMHIGPVACAYYGLAAIDAAWNCAQDGDEGSALDYLLMVLKLRYESCSWDVGEQPGFTDAVLALCERVEAEYDTLNIDEGWQGGIRSGYRDLYEKLGGQPISEPEPSPELAPGLPTVAEINVSDTFDERAAVRTFLGLTFADAEALFLKDSVVARSSLIHMGPKAFAFYLPAAIAAAKSPQAKGITQTPASELLFQLRFRAQRGWELQQMLPLTLDEGMQERLADVIELCKFAEAQPPFVPPYAHEIPEGSSFPEADPDDPDYDAMFRLMLEQVRDRLPRPARLADGTTPEFPTNTLSDDALVFLPAVAPKKRAEFLKWYSEVTQWEPNRGYEDPAVCDAPLRAWLDDMVAEIAPIAGSLRRPESDITRKADYCCAPNFIYFTASPRDPAPVWNLALDLAGRHKLGVFLISNKPGEIYLPDGKGGLNLASQRS
jgi:hypothetical protein